MNEEFLNMILSSLNLATLQRLKNKCESYLTYCIDFKQINGKYAVKTMQSAYSEFLNKINAYICLKQLESDKNTNSAISSETNITSCMDRDNQQESKTKEKKSK